MVPREVEAIMGNPNSMSKDYYVPGKKKSDDERPGSTEGLAGPTGAALGAAIGSIWGMPTAGAEVGAGVGGAVDLATAAPGKAWDRREAKRVLEANKASLAMAEDAQRKTEEVNPQAQKVQKAATNEAVQEAMLKRKAPLRYDDLARTDYLKRNNGQAII